MATAIRQVIPWSASASRIPALIMIVDQVVRPPGRGGLLARWLPERFERWACRRT
jgi:hypothetical protein